MLRGRRALVGGLALEAPVVPFTRPFDAIMINYENKVRENALRSKIVQVLGVQFCLQKLSSFHLRVLSRPLTPNFFVGIALSAVH